MTVIVIEDVQKDLNDERQAVSLMCFSDNTVSEEEYKGISAAQNFSHQED
ncbi:hypothetical protein ACFQ5E_04180 [Oceanobacillus sojae]